MSRSEGTEKAFKLLRVKDLDALPPAEWLLDRMIQAGSQVVLYGPPGEGKSFVALSMALAIATGRDWMGRATTQGPVVYVAAEGGRGIRKRIAAWQKHHGVEEVESAFFLLEAVQIRDLGERKRFIEALCAVKPVLVVFDTFARTLVGGDENQAKDVGEWVEASRQIQENTGATIVAVHHTVKRTTRHKRAPERGSSALRGAADTMMSVGKADGYVMLSCEKQKDEEEFAPIVMSSIKLALGVDADGQEITSFVLTAAGSREAVGAASLSRGAQTALEVLHAIVTDGTVTKADWAKAISERTGKDVPDKTFHNWADDLLSAGLIRREGVGRYAIVDAESATATAVPPSAIRLAA